MAVPRRAQNLRARAGVGNRLMYPTEVTIS